MGFRIKIGAEADGSIEQTKQVFEQFFKKLGKEVKSVSVNAGWDELKQKFQGISASVQILDKDGNTFTKQFRQIKGIMREVEVSAKQLNNELAQQVQFLKDIAGANKLSGFVDNDLKQQTAELTKARQDANEKEQRALDAIDSKRQNTIAKNLLKEAEVTRKVQADLSSQLDALRQARADADERQRQKDLRDLTKHNNAKAKLDLKASKDAEKENEKHVNDIIKMNEKLDANINYKGIKGATLAAVDKYGKSAIGGNVNDMLSKASPTAIKHLNDAFNNLVNTTIKAKLSMADLDKIYSAFISGDTKKIASLFGTLTKEEEAVATASLRVNAAMRGVREDISKAGQSAKDMAEHVRNITISWASFQRLIIARAITSVFYQLQNYMAESVTTANELSIRIAEIQTLSPKIDQTANAYQRLKNQILATSNAFNIPILEVAEATYEALSNQIAISASQVKIFIDNAIELSKVTVSTLDESANAIASIINSYNLSVGETVKITETLFKLVDLGRLRLSDIDNSIGSLTSMSGQLGISLDQISNAFATLTIKGIPTYVSMTLLRNMMQKLQDPTKSMTRLLGEWGVKNADVLFAAKSLSEVLDLMLGKMQEGSDVINDLAGTSRAARAYIGLLGDGLGKFNAGMEEFNNKTQTFKDALDVRMKAPAEQVNKELNEIKNFFVQYSSNIIEKIAQINKGLEKQGSSIGNVAENTISLGVNIGAVLGTYAGIRQLASGLGNLSKIMSTTLVTEGTLSALLLGSGGLAISASVAVVAAVGAIWYKMYTQDTDLLDRLLAESSKKVEAFAKRLEEKIANSASAMRDEIDKRYKELLAPDLSVSQQLNEANKQAEIEYTEEIRKQNRVLEEQVKTLEDRKDIVKENISDIKKEINEYENELDKVKKIRREHGASREDFFFDRRIRGLNDVQQAYAKMSRSQELAARAQQLWEQSQGDPAKFKANYDDIKKLNDESIRYAKEADKELYNYFQNYGQELGRQRESQYRQTHKNAGNIPNQVFDVRPEQLYNFGQFDQFFQQRFNFEDQINANYEDTLKSKIEDLNTELDSQQSIQDDLNVSIDYYKKVQDQIRDVASAINDINSDSSYTESEKLDLIQRQEGVLQSIFGYESGIQKAIEKQVEIRKQIAAVDKNQQNLVNLKKQEEDAVTKITDAKTNALSVDKDALNNLEDYVVLLERVRDKSNPAGDPNFGYNTKAAYLKYQKNYKQTNDFIEKLKTLQTQLQNEHLSSNDRAKLFKDVQALQNQYSGTASELARNSQFFSGNDDRYYTQTLEQMNNIRNSINSAVKVYSELDNKLQQYEQLHQQVLDTQKTQNSVLTDVQNNLKDYNIQISLSVGDQAQAALQIIKDRTKALHDEADAAIAAANANRANNAAVANQNLIDQGIITPSGYAKGGLVDWSPQGQDRIPSLLSYGEFVINPQATKRFLPLLQAINAGKLSGRSGFKPFSLYDKFEGTTQAQFNNNITINSSGDPNYDARRLMREISRQQRRSAGSLSANTLPVR